MRTKIIENNFDSVVGNKAAISILQNIIASGNIASAYLFNGISGVGKCLTSTIFARYLVESDVEMLVVKGVESIKIEQIHEAITFASIKPVIGNRKFIIIDAETGLSEKCGNALLKLLEEPSSYCTIIIISSSEVLPTIKSRCHIIDFLPLSKVELLAVVDCEDNRISENIIDAACGSAKNALQLIEAWDILSPFVKDLSNPPTSILKVLSYSNELTMLDFHHQVLLLQLLATTWWKSGNQKMLNKATIAKSYLDCKVSPPKVWDNLLVP
ncbi:MAG: hypothetical protein HC815_05820 [Richelia sp. RM1_1_1]|nr:hypothetical protein [Richelia sp. RM1_1_1]